MSSLVTPLLFILLVTPTAALCPTQCDCSAPPPPPASAASASVSASVSVSCASASLGTVPLFLNPGVTHLDLSSNRVRRLEGALSFYDRLIDLDLSSNRLRHLGRRQFEQQTRLSHLNLSDNALTSLHTHSETFVGLSNLQVLDLSSNLLELLPSNVFAGMETLLELRLDNNKVRSVESDAFLGLRRLRTLRLSNNNLHSLRSEGSKERWLSSLQSLRVIELSLNLLAAISDDEMCGGFVSLLEIIHLDHNILKRVDNFAFRGCRSVHTLSLEGNQLSKVPALSLSQMSRLSTLDLSANPLSELRADSLEALFHLEHLQLNHMTHLRRIDQDAFHDVQRLRKLSMNNNPLLSPLPWGLLDKQTLLKELSLSNNTLWRSIFEEQVGQASNLRVLDLSGLRAECNCSLLWLRRLYNSTDELLVSPDVYCHSIDGLQVERVRLGDVEERRLTCSSTAWTSESALLAALAVATACLVVFVILAMAIVVRCRGKRGREEGDCVHVKDDTMIFTPAMGSLAAFASGFEKSGEEADFSTSTMDEPNYEEMRCVVLDTTSPKLYWHTMDNGVDTKVDVDVDDVALTARHVLRTPTRFLFPSANASASLINPVSGHTTVPRYTESGSSPCSSASTNVGTLSSSSNGSSDLSRRQQHRRHHRL